MMNIIRLFGNLLKIMRMKFKKNNWIENNIKYNKLNFI